MEDQADPIRHVVHLMLENRSFDQMLGCLKEVYPDLDGIDPTALHDNVDTAARAYKQEPTKLRQMLIWDPHHEVDHVAIQLAKGNSGFVLDFSTSYKDSTQDARQQIMSY
jgi:phospholipase C